MEDLSLSPSPSPLSTALGGGGSGIGSPRAGHSLKRSRSGDDEEDDLLPARKPPMEQGRAGVQLPGSGIGSGSGGGRRVVRKRRQDRSAGPSPLSSPRRLAAGLDSDPEDHGPDARRHWP
jgi:hypothetical protein